jgi:hypothetical protein
MVIKYYEAFVVAHPEKLEVRAKLDELRKNFFELSKTSYQRD